MDKITRQATVIAASLGLGTRVEHCGDTTIVECVFVSIIISGQAMCLRYCGGRYQEVESLDQLAVALGRVLVAHILANQK